MLTGLALTVAAVGAGPYGFGPDVYATESFGGVTSSGVYGVSHNEQLYPYEAQQPWLHGYYQEIPAYGGFHAFKPYNYKHLLSQSQTAAGFGMSPVMPYSQQFWHRYENRANLSPYANEPGVDVPMPLPAGMPYGVPSASVVTPPPAAVAPTPPAAPPEWNQGPVIMPANAEVRGAGPAILPARRAEAAAGRWSGWNDAAR